MKVTGLETVLLGEFPNLCYVRVHTDEGVSGLGETFFGAEAVAAWVHETAASYLLGKDPPRIDALGREALANPFQIRPRRRVQNKFRARHPAQNPRP